MNNLFASHLVKNLLLLVGENPLPNYVAARLLLEKGGTPYLIHTVDTEREAFQLKEVLDDERGDTGFEPAQLKSLEQYESDAYRIQTEVGELVKCLPAGRIGLNYTGGTKPMAVHAYRGVLNTTSKESEPVFSYLDPRRLKLCIDRQDGKRTRISVRPEDLSVSLKTIFRLHGRLWSTEPRQDPIYAGLSSALAQVMSEEETATAWLAWLHQSFWDGNGHLEQAAKPIKKNGKGRDWTSKSKLKQLIFPLEKMPKLVREQFPKSLLTEDGHALSMEAVLKDGAFRKLKNYCEWLDGLWLEHHVLNELGIIAESAGLSEYGMSFKVPLEGTRDGFEFDVAFTYGYQLFAISCTTENINRGLCKSKLLEAYVRALQMGGQEARIALVCGLNEPESLEAELADLVSKQQIRVFGRQQLPRLADEISRWIAENDAELKR
ncbi:MAG: DUF1887 domain-containing protein [Cyanobacteria bacterium P01_F01_bin.150]